ncbi:hypothetical protein PENNAL_c0184G03517, partial [Penicillium nalgiovense]
MSATIPTRMTTTTRMMMMIMYYTVWPFYASPILRSATRRDIPLRIS